MLKKIIGLFFGWETIYMTSNLEEYATIRGRLIDQGIKTKTRTYSSNSFRGGRHSGMLMGSIIRNNYEILVRKEDVHKARQTIQSLKSGY